jgi:hypothetical protein
MSFIRLKLLQVSMLQKKILARAGPTLFHTEDQKRAAIDTDDGATAAKRGEGKSEADQDEYVVAMLHAQVGQGICKFNKQFCGR